MNLVNLNEWNSNILSFSFFCDFLRQSKQHSPNVLKAKEEQ